MIKLAVAGAAGRMGRTLLGLVPDDGRFDVVSALTLPNDPLMGSAISLGDKEIRLSDRFPDAEQSEERALLPCDVLIDFTVADGTMAWLAACEHRQVPMVIGATGHSEEQLEQIAEAAHTIPIVRASNFSSGIQAILDALEVLVPELGDSYDVEIVETHHRHKFDAPSGTANTIAHAIQTARERSPVAPSGLNPNDCEDPSRVGDVGRPHEITPDEAESAESAKRHPATKLVFGRHGQTGERPPGEIGVHSVRMGDVVGEHEIHFSGCGETITLRHIAQSRETFAAGALRAAAWIVSQEPGLYGMKDVLAAK